MLVWELAEVDITFTYTDSSGWIAFGRKLFMCSSTFDVTFTLFAIYSIGTGNFLRSNDPTIDVA